MSAREWAAAETAAINLGLYSTLPTLHVLADLAAKMPGAPFPSQKWIAEKTGQCVRTVRYHIALLRNAGILTVKGSPGRHREDGTYTRQTNRYYLGLGRIWQLIRDKAAGRTRRQRPASVFALRAKKKTPPPSQPARDAPTSPPEAPPPLEEDWRRAPDDHRTAEEVLWDIMAAAGIREPRLC